MRITRPPAPSIEHMIPVREGTASLHALSVESTALIQMAFFSALIFLVLYTPRCWWRTLHGRCLGWVSIAVAGVLLRPVLYDWHVLSLFRDRPDLGEWITTQLLLLLPAAFLVMSWQLVRPWVRPWLVAHHLARDYAPGKEHEDVTI